MHEDKRNLSPRNNALPSESLAERLDHKVGEVSIAISGGLGELMRQTLRGGIAKIETEIDGLVDEKVGMNVSQRMPEFEQTAARTAEERARAVAGEAVEGIRQEASQSVEQLTRQIEETRTHADHSLSSTTDKLTSSITESESRAMEKARSLVNDHIGELSKKSQKTYQAVQEKLSSLSGNATAVQQHLKELRQQVKELHQQVRELRQQLTQELEQRDGELEKLLEYNRQLNDRLSELERPRGMKAMWNKVFSRKSKDAPHRLEHEEPQKPGTPDAEEEQPRE